MSYTHEQFLLDVTAEATALKEHATKEEISRLDIEQLKPSSDKHCIYGLLTGNCNSKRAKELIQKCAPTLLHNEVDGTQVSMDNINTAGREGFVYLSPIEMYIMKIGANSRGLIAFLRDERKDLVL